jgi:hypothetical protein
MKLEQETDTDIILLQSWGLSKLAIDMLSQKPEIVAKLQKAKELPSFPADYVPEKIEEKFDNTIFRRFDYGVLTYERQCFSSHKPYFVEYCFDEQTALFFVNGEFIVNRLELMAESADLVRNLAPTQYSNAFINAEEYINAPPLSTGYKAKEIEVFFGDSPTDSTYHYRDSKWFSINLDNVEKEPVIQILIDNQWAFIQVEDEILLDRMGSIELPVLPNKEEFLSLLAWRLSG